MVKKKKEPPIDIETIQNSFVLLCQKYAELGEQLKVVAYQFEPLILALKQTGLVEVENTEEE